MRLTIAYSLIVLIVLIGGAMAYRLRVRMAAERDRISGRPKNR